MALSRKNSFTVKGKPKPAPEAQLKSSLSQSREDSAKVLTPLQNAQPAYPIIPIGQNQNFWYNVAGQVLHDLPKTHFSDSLMGSHPLFANMDTLYRPVISARRLGPNNSLEEWNKSVFEPMERKRIERMQQVKSPRTSPSLAKRKLHQTEVQNTLPPQLKVSEADNEDEDEIDFALIRREYEENQALEHGEGLDGEGLHEQLISPHLPLQDEEVQNQEHAHLGASPRFGIARSITINNKALSPVKNRLGQLGGGDYNGGGNRLQLDVNGNFIDQPMRRRSRKLSYIG